MSNVRNVKCVSPLEHISSQLTLRSRHLDVFFNIAVLNLWSNSLKNTYDGMQFLVNLQLPLSCF